MIRGLDRTKHEAMLRREMTRGLADWPSSPYAIPEPSEAEKAAFVEAFIVMSRPAGDRAPRQEAPAPAQRDLFPEA